jgi:GT2 family glycosyltransferase
MVIISGTGTRVAPARGLLALSRPALTQQEAAWMIDNCPAHRSHPELGIVVIGRNEGERLQRCLASLNPPDHAIVYVDSGSSDGSVALARGMGADVVELDQARPFTAARARNEGLARLLQAHPRVELVQFIDGDCEAFATWLPAARQAMAAWPEAGVIWGGLRERFPDASIYNRLCDLEWYTPPGETRACGGIALMRVAALRDVGGFHAGLIAGEDTELCHRLCGAGWKIVRIDAEMARHDAAMTRFGQWWKRAVRTGHAYAQVSALHRGTATPMWIRESRSAWFWGLGLPLIAVVLTPFSHGLSLLLLLGYLVLAWRVYRHRVRGGDVPAHATCYAAFCVLAKFAHVLGQCRYQRDRFRGRPSLLLEYKRPAQITS